MALVFLPIGIATMATWVVFRKEPTGLHLQTVAGFFIIVYLLSYRLYLHSLKTITLLFVVFLSYDVFFVYITPYIPGLSKRGTSVMEDVLLGPAGRNNELMPGAFAVTLPVIKTIPVCPAFRDTSMLGFGDAGIPGILIGFMAVYDCVWKIRFRLNFIASCIGYVIGLVLADLLVFLTEKGAPALITICPATLITQLCVTTAFFGREELQKMWQGTFPDVKESAQVQSV